ncbi:MAG: UDP-N-acetylmuramoyl-L-alanine--D-glutamate ligase [Desulfobacteraceae bacterium]
MNSDSEKTTVVAGAGKSGISIARFLNSLGYRVIVTDSDPGKQEAGKGLEKEGIASEIGFHRHETFETADRIVTSPGIPLDMAYFTRARAKGVPVTGELDLFAGHIQTPVIAVSGTNGKTTVTTMISRMLKASGLEVFTCGNIGRPMVDYFLENRRADVVVAEVSSFQLDTACHFKPDVAVLLNITEDHLDRYPDFTAYGDSKWSLFKNQTEHQTAILNCNLALDPRIGSLRSALRFFNLPFPGKQKCIMDNGELAFEKSGAVVEPGRILITGAGAVDISGTMLVGRHNRENLAAAALAALAAGASLKGIQECVDAFTGLAHRTQYVGTINGTACYNDSKATNCDAVVRAVESFAGNIVLIMGGKEKNSDFSCLADIVKTRVKTIIALGEAKKKIKKALGRFARVSFAGSMAEAVELAAARAEKGDIILLSPGCASFDMYQSYAHRGEAFAKQVKKRWIMGN